MRIDVQPYYLFLFTIVFALFTIIGTLSHEYGHIVVAKYFGYKTTLHYGSMTFERNDGYSDYETIYSKHKHEIENNIPFPEKVEFYKLLKELKFESFLISIGGPTQTILTGLFGIFALFIRRESIRKTGLKLIDWLSVFLSLFWLREVFNLIVSIASGILNRNGKYFAGDEAKISKIAGFQIGTLPIILGLIGIIVSVFVIFKVVPKKLRLTFIVSGLIGGLAGFILWMEILGPIILPY